MSSITVQKTARAEIVTIQAFELLEADGAGIRDLSRGFVATEAEAMKWRERSTGYHSYKPVTQRIIVSNTLEDHLHNEERDKVNSLLNMMKGHELELLRKHIDMLMDAPC